MIKVVIEMSSRDGFPERELAKNLAIYEHDVIDGCEITAHIDGYDNTQDFFIGDCEIVEAVVGKTRSELLLNNALAWIYNSLTNEEEYINVCRHIGMIDKEIIEEKAAIGYSSEME